MKIGIYVGSFNPVHIGHIDIASKLLKYNYVDIIYIVPTLGYWHKQNLVSIEDRINMLRLVSTDKILIDDQNNKLSYTYQIMDIYNKKYPDADIKLIIGADNLKNFHKWVNYKKLLDYGVIVVSRNNIDVCKYSNITVADFDTIDISSTEIRNNDKDRSKYLHPKVLEYLNDKKLY